MSVPEFDEGSAGTAVPTADDFNSRYRVIGDVPAFQVRAFLNWPVCIGTPAGIRCCKLRTVEISREHGGPMAVYETRYTNPATGESESIRLIFGIEDGLPLLQSNLGRKILA